MCSLPHPSIPPSLHPSILPCPVVWQREAEVKDKNDQLLSFQSSFEAEIKDKNTDIQCLQVQVQVLEREVAGVSEGHASLIQANDALTTRLAAQQEESERLRQDSEDLTVKLRAAEKEREEREGRGRRKERQGRERAEKHAGEIRVLEHELALLRGVCEQRQEERAREQAQADALLQAERQRVRTRMWGRGAVCLRM